MCMQPFFVCVAGPTTQSKIRGRSDCSHVPACSVRQDSTFFLLSPTLLFSNSPVSVICDFVTCVRVLLVVFLQLRVVSQVEQWFLCRAAPPLTSCQFGAAKPDEI